MDEQQAWARLTSERAATLQQLAAMTDELTALAAASLDSNIDDEHDPEGSTVAFEREQFAGLRARAQTHLDEIDAALHRLRADRYGVCDSCGRPVGDERLAALPAAVLCLRCATRRDRR